MKLHMMIIVPSCAYLQECFELCCSFFSAEDKQSLMTELSQCQQANRALRAEFDNLIIQHQQEMQNIQIAKVSVVI